MASQRKERCFEAVTATSTHGIEKFGAVRAKGGVLLAIAVWQDGRDVELTGSDTAVLMALEVDEIARDSVSRSIGLGEMVDTLIYYL